MPGSKDDPVKLDFLQSIFEVGWSTGGMGILTFRHNVQAFSVFGYKWSLVSGVHMANPLRPGFTTTDDGTDPDIGVGGHFPLLPTQAELDEVYIFDTGKPFPGRPLFSSSQRVGGDENYILNFAKMKKDKLDFNSEAFQATMGAHWLDHSSTGTAHSESISLLFTAYRKATIDGFSIGPGAGINCDGILTTARESIAHASISVTVTPTFNGANEGGFQDLGPLFYNLANEAHFGFL